MNKKIVCQVGNNKKVMLWCTANQISRPVITSACRPVYRVIQKSLRDFRPLRYSSRDGHAEGSMSTEGETLQVTVLPYSCSVCPPLVTRQMSIFGKFQGTERFLIPCPRHVSSQLPTSGENCKYATVPITKKWRDSLPIDMLLSAVSVLVVAQQSSEVPEGLTNYRRYNLTVFFFGTVWYNMYWQNVSHLSSHWSTISVTRVFSLKQSPSPLPSND